MLPLLQVLLLQALPPLAQFLTELLPVHSLLPVLPLLQALPPLAQFLTELLLVHSLLSVLPLLQALPPLVQFLTELLPVHSPLSVLPLQLIHPPPQAPLAVLPQTQLLQILLLQYHLPELLLPARSPALLPFPRNLHHTARILLQMLHFPV